MMCAAGAVLHPDHEKAASHFQGQRTCRLPHNEALSMDCLPAAAMTAGHVLAIDGGYLAQ
jgi:hypothetical protein